MFYILSKILTFIISPYYWILLLILTGLILKNTKHKKWSFFLAALIFFILGNRALINTTYKMIEYKPLYQFEIKDAFKYGVLLGGGFVSMDEKFPDRVQFNAAANRFTESMELFYSGKIKSLLVSGGVGGIGRVKNVEALHAKTFLNEIHWPDSALLIEYKSRNTYENALFVKEIFDSLQYKDQILLITSALHMKRALGCFKKQNIKAIPYAADYMQRQKLEFLSYILPDLDCLGEWQSIMKEWIGYKVYQLKKYI